MLFNEQQFLNLTLSVNDMSIIYAAHAYLDCGLQLVPYHSVRQGDKWEKKPVYIKNVFESWKNHPITDHAMINKIWNLQPEAYIAVIIPKNYLIVDVDTKNNGDVNQDYLYDSPVCLTPSGGIHSWRSDQSEHILSKTPVYPGTDFLRAGRLVIMPPSVRPDYQNNPYIWVKHETPKKLPVSVKYELTRQFLPKYREVKGTLQLVPSNDYEIFEPQYFINEMRHHSAGGRNDYFFKKVKDFMRSKNCTNQDIYALADAAVASGLTPSEVATTLESARRSISEGA